MDTPSKKHIIIVKKLKLNTSDAGYSSTEPFNFDDIRESVKPYIFTDRDIKAEVVGDEIVFTILCTEEVKRASIGFA